MNTLLLQPTDVLFFRDGRPMSGSLAGHTAAWPMPDVTNHALHAALHRAGFNGVHQHRRGQSGSYSDQRDRKFGSLLTAGPFPVDSSGSWFFSRPKDTHVKGAVRITFRPVRCLGAENDQLWTATSLPKPLAYAVASTEPPSKEAGGEPWISLQAFGAYIKEKPLQGDPDGQFLHDGSIADKEANLGIGIDPETETAGQGAAAGKIYTAHYLRLREGFRLGILAEASDKAFTHAKYGNDLIRSLLNGEPTKIVVGGQQRLCTATCELTIAPSLNLPCGLDRPEHFKQLPNGKYAVKWVLLSPAIFPQIPEKKKDGTPQNPHPGGWLPNWIARSDGKVLLTLGHGVQKAARKGTKPGTGVAARLVAALVPKPLPVTGWALPNDSDRTEGGAKSTHLAVAAGAVYYFEADSSEEAAKLATVLNWHGSDREPTTVKNRRSTLLGEKGYGLGVCGTWDFWENVCGRPKA